MASFKLSNIGDRFPAGTTVTVYPRSNWGTGQLPPSGAPIGSSTTSAAVDTTGTVVFSGVSPNEPYVAYAPVNSEHRYVHFRVSEKSGKDTYSAAVAASTLGDNTVVAAQAGKNIRVHGYVLVAAGAVVAKWKSGASTDLTGGMSFAANGGISVPGEEDRMLFETAPGQALVLNLSAAVSVAGHVQYALEG